MAPVGIDREGNRSKLFLQRTVNLMAIVMQQDLVKATALSADSQQLRPSGSVPHQSAQPFSLNQPVKLR